MNRSPSPDTTARRAERQALRVVGQQVAVSQKQIAAVESTAVAAVVGLNVDLSATIDAIDERVYNLENPIP